MGVHGLGLCPTQNRPAHIGWEVERPAVDRRQPQVELDRAPVDNGQVDRSRSEFQPLDLCRIFAENRQIFTGSCQIFVGSSPNLYDNHEIEARKTTLSPNLNENFHLIVRSSPYLHWIFARSVDFSLDLCDNHEIEAENTTSSPDLSKNYLIAGSN